MQSQVPCRTRAMAPQCHVLGPAQRSIGRDATVRALAGKSLTAHLAAALTSTRILLTNGGFASTNGRQLCNMNTAFYRSL